MTARLLGDPEAHGVGNRVANTRGCQASSAFKHPSLRFNN